MAITPTHLTAGQGTGSDTSVTTASITPGSQRLVLVFVRTAVTVATPNIPTVTGNSLTYVQAVSALAHDSTLKRMSAFRALGSPTAGTVVIDFAGQTQSEIAYSILDVSGVNLGGTNGSAAVVQAVADSTSFSALNFTVTLGAFSSLSNATFGAFHEPDNTALSPGSGFTTINAFAGGSGGALLTEWRVDNDTTVDASSAVQDNWQAIALEIAPQPPPATPGGQVIARVQGGSRVSVRPQRIVM